MVSWTLANGICELSLAAEPCNEIGTKMLNDLEHFLDSNECQAARSLIIHSTQKAGFSAGADLKELYQEILSQPVDSRTKELRGFLDRIHAVMNRLDMLPIPTIGVIHGVCFGGGFELALTCDILIAENTARFCFPELRLGIIPVFGGLPRLARDIPGPVIRDLLFTGRSINARKAQSIGLVSQLVANGEGLHVARKSAEQMTKYDALAQAEAKKFIKTLPLEEMEKEKEIFIRLSQRQAFVNGLKTFVESDDIRPYLAQGKTS